MSDDDIDEFFEPLSKKKHKDDKWGEKFRIKGNGGVYTVSRAKYGGMSIEPWGCTCPGWKFNHPEGGCKHIQSVADFYRTLQRISEGKLVAMIDFYVDNHKAFHFWGQTALNRVEQLTGVRRESWVMLNWSATKYPSANYEIGKDVRLAVSYMEHDERNKYDEGIQ